MKPRIIRFLVRVIVVSIILVSFFILGIYLFSPKQYNVLIIGSDQREGLHATDVSVKRGRSDVLMVISVPKKNKDDFSILMIPRDTYVNDDEYGDQKMTHYYAMGERYESKVLGNLPLTQEKIEELLDEKMDATFEVSFAGFSEIIDLMGGVEISTGHVDSDAAIEMVHNRFVHSDGDFGRAGAQREILKGALQKAKDFSMAKKIYNYIDDSEEVRLEYDKIKTIGFGVSFLMSHGKEIDFSDIKEIELPGQGTRINGLYYWQADEEEVKNTVKEYLK